MVEQSINQTYDCEDFETDKLNLKEQKERKIIFFHSKNRFLFYASTQRKTCMTAFLITLRKQYIKQGNIFESVIL